MRELAEETGYEPGKLKAVWSYDQDGTTRFSKTIYIATDLKRLLETHPDGGEKITLLEVSLDEALQMCHEYKFRQYDAMLCLLNLCHEEKAGLELAEWLKNSKTA